MIKNVCLLHVKHFSTLSNKGHDFRKKLTEFKMCVFLFSLQHLSEIFLILRRTERDMINNVYRSAACTDIFSTLSHKRQYSRNKVIIIIIGIQPLSRSRQ
jgi:hypothetical protein